MPRYSFFPGSRIFFYVLLHLQLISENLIYELDLAMRDLVGLLNALVSDVLKSSALLLTLLPHKTYL